MSFAANINVWTLGKGANGKWKLHFSTESLDEAGAWFQELEQAGKQVALYELGLFLHDGQQVAGQVAFWWSANFNERMEREPVGRGVGWTDGYETWVEYTFPEPAASLPSPWDGQLPATVPEPSYTPEPVPVVAEPVHRYVEGACDRCGIILPKHQLQPHTRDVRSGFTTGSFRNSRSTSTRSSARGISNSSTFGSSSSSGRSYYRRETVLLCASCYPKDGALTAFWKYMTRLD